ncbi:MAG: hypothetical protein ABR611_04875 [Chthoniobacterales bacterium]
MAYFKARVDYSKDADGDLSGPSHNIHAKLVLNAATFPALPITMAAFLTIITTWDTALGESLKGGTDRTTTENNARMALENALFKLGTYVNLVADGDKATIDLSGFESYDTAHPQSTGGVTFIPQNVRWEDGTVSGAAALRWKGDGKGSLYEVQTCTGDPNTEANWSYRGSFSGGRADLAGFTPGTVIWGRARRIGTGGEVGGWSDPAQKRVN